MFEHQEDIFNKNLENVLKQDGSFHGDLDELSKIALSLKHLPRKNTPFAHRRQLYLVENALMESIPAFSKFRILLFSSSGLLLLLVTITSAAIYSSSPGTQLFRYKNTAQRIPINLSLNQESKLSKELSLAQKRLSEVKEIINSDPENTELTIAALNELAKQTENTVATIDKAVKANSVPENTEIINRLDSFAKEQLEVLSSMKTNPETEQVAQKALSATEKTSKKVASIKEIIATSHDEVIADPSILSKEISGIITALKDNTITLDSNTTVTLSEDTRIIFSNQSTSTPKLAIKQKVTVLANEKNGALVATNITIEQIQSSQTTTSNPKVDSTDPSSQDVDTDQEESVEAPKPAETKATFIPEDPNPQPIN